ncbi:hypothetical protein NFI96_005261 [Prochilodus magdalenae]|nr:hypothetical protein NFI96_005261 [Prochilodus magdalenae]
MLYKEGAGALPSTYWAKGREYPGQATSQTAIRTYSHLKGQVSISSSPDCMSWDCGGKPTQIQGEHSKKGTLMPQLGIKPRPIMLSNSLLAGLPLRAIRPLQLVQNAAARLIFNLPKFTHVTPLLRSLHWLPVVVRIRFKTLMLAYKAKNGPAPPYVMAMVKSRAVPRALRASSTARLDPPYLRTHGRQASRLFSVLAPRWWNELPLGVRTAGSLAVFKRRLNTHLFVKHLSDKSSS